MSVTPLVSNRSAVSNHLVSSSPDTVKSGMLSTVNILGMRFHVLSFAEALDVIEGFVSDRVPSQITFANAQTIACCRRSPDLMELINESNLTLADGMSIVWGARMLGLRLPERVAGPDIMYALAGRAAEKKYKVFLMGTSPENLIRLKETLLSSWPGLNVVGMHSPPMCERISSEETLIIEKKIKATLPDILFVGISCPKQERWIHQNKQRLGVPVSLGVGAAFDFLSGSVPRAPEWLRLRGLEWVFRLYKEPRRLWKRYLLGNLVFLYLLARHRLGSYLIS